MRRPLVPLLAFSLGAAALLTSPLALTGQTVRRDPGVEIGGKIVVKVYLTLSDDAQPYAPVVGHRVVFYRSGDSTVARTDDVGLVTVLLEPGSYRVVTPEIVSWHGGRFFWSVPITVRRDMPAVDLTIAEAKRPTPAYAASGSAGVSATPSAPSSVQAPVGAALVAAPAPATPPAAPPMYLYKDPGTATIISLLLAGGGQFYAGEPGRGLLFLGGDVAGLVLMLDGAHKSADCAYYGDYYSSYSCTGSDGRGEVAAGLGLAFGSYLVSVIDAHSAAHRHNQRVGIEPPPQRRVSALVGAGRSGQARAGLRVAFGR